MSFHEVRLPARLAFGSTGGVERRTEVVTLASGLRAPLDALGAWPAPVPDRGRGAVAGRRRRAGRVLRGAAGAAARLPVPGLRRLQVLRAVRRPFRRSIRRSGVGDGETTVFALAKAYGDLARPVTKPVDGTVRVAVDGVEVTAVSVDATTGLVTFEDPPGEGAVLTAGFEFDTPVRFDADRIDVTLESFEAGRVVAVPLIELRV
jgi:hypothetical protein